MRIKKPFGFEGSYAVAPDACQSSGVHSRSRLPDVLPNASLDDVIIDVDAAIGEENAKL